MTMTITIEKLQKISSDNTLWNDTFGKEGKRAVLSDLSLQCSDLRGYDLRDADLRGSNLTWANLRGVNLQNANLEGANVKNTILDDEK